jgi:hypothetical protein
MDGHSSHYTLDLLRYAEEHNIIVLGCPPHCTHVLQGLDVVCFAKMKTEFRKEIQVFEDLHLANVGKKDFAGVFGRAYLRAFTPETIKAAFAATGLHPFNPEAITEKQMKPSLPTSTESSFPLPQPSPVRAIIAAMGSRPPTALELSPSHFATVSTHTDSPVTPTRRRLPPCDPNIDPLLDSETPSKRLRLMYGGLGSTSTGSLLLSKARLTSSYSIHPPVLETLPKLPQPDWSLLEAQPSSGYESRDSLERKITALTTGLHRSRDIIHAREQMDESKNAQLVIQNTELRKLKQTVNAKEAKAKEKCTTVFKKGLGRHLTDPELIQALASQELEKEAEVEARSRRAAVKEARRVARAAVEDEWKTIKAAHEADVAAWKSTCTELRVAGTRPKDLPPKLRRPLKPKPVLEELPEGNEDDEEGSDSLSEDDK